MAGAKMASFKILYQLRKTILIFLIVIAGCFLLAKNNVSADVYPPCVHDGSCTGDETCINCSLDCGQCPIPLPGVSPSPGASVPPGGSYSYCGSWLCPGSDSDSYGLYCWPACDGGAEICYRSPECYQPCADCTVCGCGGDWFGDVPACSAINLCGDSQCNSTTGECYSSCYDCPNPPVPGPSIIPSPLPLPAMTDIAPQVRALYPPSWPWPVTAYLNEPITFIAEYADSTSDYKPGNSLVINGSFEDATIGWWTWPVAMPAGLNVGFGVVNGGLFGSKSFQISTKSTIYGNVASVTTNSISSGFSAGQVMTASLWYQTDEEITDAWLKVNYTANGIRNSWWNPVRGAPTLDPQFLKKTFTVPADTTSLEVEFQVRGGGVDQLAWVDGVKLESGNTDGMYTDIKEAQFNLENSTVLANWPLRALFKPNYGFYLKGSSGGLIGPTAITWDSTNKDWYLNSNIAAPDVTLLGGADGTFVRFNKDGSGEDVLTINWKFQLEQSFPTGIWNTTLFVKDLLNFEDETSNGANDTLHLVQEVDHQRETWNASTDFSTVQKLNNWSYQYIDAAGVYQDMVYSYSNPGSPGNWWHHSNTSLWCLWWNIGGHPCDFPVVKTWKSPLSGTITITDTISDTNRTCGNGVRVSVWRTTGAQPPNRLWQQAVPNIPPPAPARTYPLNLTTAILEGDLIHFQIDALADWGCDGTNFNPTITYSGTLPSHFWHRMGSLEATAGTGSITGNVYQSADCACSGTDSPDDQTWTVTCGGDGIDGVIDGNRPSTEASPTSNSSYTCEDTSDDSLLPFGTYSILFTSSTGQIERCAVSYNVDLVSAADPPVTPFYQCLPQDPWWQTVDGNIHSDGQVISSVPDNQWLMTGDPAILSYGTLGTDLLDSIRSVSPLYAESGYEATVYNYSWWDRHLRDEEKREAPSFLTEIADDGVYTVTSGDQIRGSADNGVKIVILHDGDLNLTGDIEVDPGSFLMVVASGKITIDDSVTIAQGIFIADEIEFATGGSSSDSQLAAQGTFIGWNGISILRDIGSIQSIINPSVVFTYRPDLVVNAPEFIQRIFYTWEQKPG